MDSNQPQYQRAVTPTVDNNLAGGILRGKPLLQTSNSSRGRMKEVANPNAQIRGSRISPQRNPAGSIDVGIYGKNVSSTPGIGAGNRGIAIDKKSSIEAIIATLKRTDLILLNEEIPADKIMFARVKNSPEMLVCFRTPEERAANPERLNLDRRQLEVCPFLEQETRLRLLNFQNNRIRTIRNLENLPNLIFLDLYNNKLSSLEGAALAGASGLRVLMAGKNRLASISNLSNLRKLDVLDLHSNDIREISGLNTLTELRVLNLAGNKLTHVKNMSCLQSLTELNLRRNSITLVEELDKLPALQRVFLSHNLIASYEDVECLKSIKYLVELSLDGNPLSDYRQFHANTLIPPSQAEFQQQYRSYFVDALPNLRHFDMKNVLPNERTSSAPIVTLENTRAGSGDSADSAGGESSKRPSEASVSGGDWGMDEKRGRNGSAEDGGSVASDDNAEVLDVNSVDDNGFPPAEADEIIGEDRNFGSNVRKSSLVQLVTGSFSLLDAPVDEILTSSPATRQSSMTSIPVPQLLSPVKPSPLPDEFHSRNDIFEVEVLSQTDKLLLVQGNNNIELTPSHKRLLPGVTKAHFFRVNLASLTSKLGGSTGNFLPALRYAKFCQNSIDSLSNFNAVIELLHGFTETPPLKLEHLVILQNPIAEMSPILFRQYALSLIFQSTLRLPYLVSFNDVPITPEERSYSASQSFMGFLPGYVLPSLTSSANPIATGRKDVKPSGMSSPAIKPPAANVRRLSLTGKTQSSQGLKQPGASTAVPGEEVLPSGASVSAALQLEQSALAAAERKVTKKGQFADVFDAAVLEIIQESLFDLLEFYE